MTALLCSACGFANKILGKVTVTYSKWSAVSFKNIDFQGDCVWTAGENIYCTVKPDDSAALTYLYDVASQSWVEHNWLVN